jgi:hypothetical protein
MNKNVAIMAVVIVALAGCTKNTASQSTKEQPKMSASNLENYAKVDFEAVLRGQKPVHAIPDPKKPDLTDGGTTFYFGEGYSLTVKSTLSEKDGIKGYMYGPIIEFKDADKTKELSNVKFYSNEDLKKLRGY